MGRGGGMQGQADDFSDLEGPGTTSKTAAVDAALTLQRSMPRRKALSEKTSQADLWQLLQPLLCVNILTFVSERSKLF